jgi:hypothetical protein
MVRRRRERAGPPWQSRPGSLGQPARLHRRPRGSAARRRAIVDAAKGTRLAVLPCTSGTWYPTALSSAVTAFRCLDGYDRHKEPPTPFGGRAASSSQLFSRASVARGARALCRRLVETPSSKHLSGLPPTQHPPQPKLVHVVRGLAGPGSIGIGRGARAGHPFLVVHWACTCKCDEVSVIFLFKFGDYMPGGLATLRFSRT